MVLFVRWSQEYGTGRHGRRDAKHVRTHPLREQPVAGQNIEFTCLSTENHSNNQSQLPVLFFVVGEGVAVGGGGKGEWVGGEA